MNGPPKSFTRPKSKMMNKTGHDATTIVDLRMKPGLMDQPKRILRPRNEAKSYAETPDVVMQDLAAYSSGSDNDEEMPMEPIQVGGGPLMEGG